MRIFAALALSAPLMAQVFSAGLRAGVPLTALFTAGPPVEAPASRFTIGPSIEIGLPHGLAVGADLLFRRTTLRIPGAAPQDAEIWEWDLPATLVYHFRAPARPFLRGGAAYNRIFGIGGATECGRGPFGEQFYCLGGAPVAELRHRGTPGVVAGGGLRFRLRSINVEPELRFSHRMDRNFGVSGSAVRSNLNQAALLISILF